jgi:hypothetical protein
VLDRKQLRLLLEKDVDVAVLALFRFLFGCLLAFGSARLLAKGYVRQAFAVPHFFFPPWPFETLWRPLPLWGMHAVYALQIVSALAIALGIRVRVFAAVFCVLFTYAHFVDLTNYLNHYWLVSLLTGLLVFIPADGALALWPSANASATVPSWYVWLFRVQLACVYFFAGLAKLNTDWLFHAMPMRIWLAANTDLPVLGALFRYPETAYVASAFGAAYDLTVPLWLLLRRTRALAYLAVVFFHLLTAQLFNIGMFPYFMIAGSVVFLEPKSIRTWLKRVVPERFLASAPAKPSAPSRYALITAAVYCATQILIPLRGHLYSGNLQWHEQGYRFGWRVMLMEKMGSAEFRMVDSQTKVVSMVRVRDYLTPQQEKAMSTQPDMLLQFAHHLHEEQARKGHDVAVYADVYVTLNGRPARHLLDPAVDLAKVEDGFGSKHWIMP